MTEPLRVVVADDSPFIRRLLTSYLQSDPGVLVVGAAGDGARAVEMVRNLRPDAVTLDVEMPGKNGVQALEEIMSDCPTPTIMLSGVSRASAEVTLQALNAGAVDFILKYTPGVDTNPDALRREIIAKVRAAAKVKVIRSLKSRKTINGNGSGSGSAVVSGVAHPPASAVPARNGSAIDNLRRGVALDPPLSGESPPAAPGHTPSAAPAPPAPAQGWPDKVVVIGASTGGPTAVRELLKALPSKFPAPIVVVQHMPASFTTVLAAQLDRTVGLPVKEAQAGDMLLPGHVLIAPGDHHLLIGQNGRVELSQGPKIGGYRPSINVAMQSIAQVLGRRVIGVVLTGMGDDGAEGLAFIRAKGGRTLAQDADTCVVNGMPQAAVDKGVVDLIGPPTRLASALIKMTQRSSIFSFEVGTP